MNHDAFIVPPGSKISLKKNYDPAYKTEFHEKADAATKLQAEFLKSGLKTTDSNEIFSRVIKISFHKFASKLFYLSTEENF